MAEVDLRDQIDYESVELLNSDDSATALLRSGATVRSDADEQLLLNLPLHTEVRLTKLALAGPVPAEAPRRLLLFANRGPLTFDSLESLEADLTLELEPAQCSGEPFGIRATKFAKLRHLTVVVMSNQGDAGCSSLCKLVFVGVPQEIKGAGVPPRKVTQSRYGDALNPI